MNIVIVGDNGKIFNLHKSQFDAMFVTIDDQIKLVCIDDEIVDFNDVVHIVIYSLTALNNELLKNKTTKHVKKNKPIPFWANDYRKKHR